MRSRFTIWHDHDVAQNIHNYRIRSVTNPRIDEFMSWLNSKPIKYSFHDWPWYEYVLLNEDDRIEMTIRYADYIEQGDNNPINISVFHDHTAPKMPDPVFDAIRDEITSEINREILEKLAQYKGQVS